MTLVSVVVPVYFNSESLPDLLRRLRATIAPLDDLEFELLFVDDGSGDGSYDLLVEAGGRDSRVRVIRLSRNFGSNAAILAGLTYARGECVAVLAADLQDPPELISEMVVAWRGGAEVVLAAREGRDDPWASRLFATVFNRLFRRFIFPDFPKDGFDFMLVSRRIASLLVAMGERNSHLFGQVMWVGFDRRVLHYRRTRREAGASGWTTMRKVKYFIDAFTAFSYLPIRLAVLLGFVLAFVGFAYGLLVVALKLAGLISIAGYSALMIVVLVASGAQLIVIGMIGEYLWRVLEESRRRPPFIVDRTHNLDRGEPSNAACAAGADPFGAGHRRPAGQTMAHGEVVAPFDR